MLKTGPIALFAFILALNAAAQNTSVYTSLAEKKCKTLEFQADEGGWYLGECPGVAGYRLQVREGDLRQAINVIDPKGKKTELNFSSVSGGFSSLGPTAEWRMKGKMPVALIVRFNVSEDPEDSSRITSYLVVVKISQSETCITHALRPTRSHNLEARRAADLSRESRCRFQ